MAANVKSGSAPFGTRPGPDDISLETLVLHTSQNFDVYARMVATVTGMQELSTIFLTFH